MCAQQFVDGVGVYLFLVNVTPSHFQTLPRSESRERQGVRGPGAWT